jgi:hypothetical protein
MELETKSSASQDGPSFSGTHVKSRFRFLLGSTCTRRVAGSEVRRLRHGKEPARTNVSALQVPEVDCTEMQRYG